MPNFEKIHQELAEIAQTENAKIRDLCRIARQLGYQQRTEGSHRTLTHPITAAYDVEATHFTLSGCEKDSAKPYQIEQATRAMGWVLVALRYPENQRVAEQLTA